MKRTNESLVLNEASLQRPEKFNYRTAKRDAQPRGKAAFYATQHEALAYHSAAIAKLKSLDPVLRPIGEYLDDAGPVPVDQTPDEHLITFK